MCSLLHTLCQWWQSGNTCLLHSGTHIFSMILDCFFSSFICCRFSWIRLQTWFWICIERWRTSSKTDERYRHHLENILAHFPHTLPSDMAQRFWSKPTNLSLYDHKHIKQRMWVSSPYITFTPQIYILHTTYKTKSTCAYHLFGKLNVPVLIPCLTLKLVPGRLCLAHPVHPMWLIVVSPAVVPVCGEGNDVEDGEDDQDDNVDDRDLPPAVLDAGQYAGLARATGVAE